MSWEARFNRVAPTTARTPTAEMRKVRMTTFCASARSVSTRPILTLADERESAHHLYMAKEITFLDIRRLVRSFEASPAEVARRLEQSRANCAAAAQLHELTEARLADSERLRGAA